MDLTPDICRLIYVLMDNPRRQRRSRPPKTTANDRPRDCQRRLYQSADHRYRKPVTAVADVNMEE